MTPRLLSERDSLSHLAEVHATCFSDAWSADALAGLLATPGAFAFVLDDAFILARAAGGEGEILTLAVMPSSRRHGSGTALVEAAAHHAQRQGATDLFLEVSVANDAARGLYGKLGFREAGRRKGYYAQPGAEPLDALVLRSNLPLTPLGK